jgi:hypothetical protein
MNKPLSDQVKFQKYFNSNSAIKNQEGKIKHKFVNDKDIS